MENFTNLIVFGIIIFLLVVLYVPLFKKKREPFFAKKIFSKIANGENWRKSLILTRKHWSLLTRNGHLKLAAENVAFQIQQLLFVILDTTDSSVTEIFTTARVIIRTKLPSSVTSLKDFPKKALHDFFEDQYNQERIKQKMIVEMRFKKSGENIMVISSLLSNDREPIFIGKELGLIEIFKDFLITAFSYITVENFRADFVDFTEEQKIALETIIEFFDDEDIAAEYGIKNGHSYIMPVIHVMKDVFCHSPSLETLTLA